MRRGSFVNAIALLKERRCKICSSLQSYSTAPQPALHESLERLASRLGITELSQWYHVSRRQVVKMGGRKLLAISNTENRALLAGALPELLQKVYPHYPWDASRWKLSPSYWKDKTNLTAFLKQATNTLGIQQAEDWYSVALSDLREIGLPRFVTKTMLADLLSELYPQHSSWEKVYLLRGRYSHQRILWNAVRSLFPAEQILMNARKEAQILNPTTGKYLELDVYIPSLHLAFEYQERHHYTHSRSSYQPLEEYQSRDHMKLELTREAGITLIVVPFWWDGSTDSLSAEIREARPELLTHLSKLDGKKIPDTAPSSLLELPDEPTVPDVGVPSLACFFTNSSIDPTSWWMYEKYDGVRAFWNPIRKAFYSRKGAPFMIPNEIIQSMPNDLFLDGELWFGRDSFQDALRIPNRADPLTIDWSRFKYMVFDVPNCPSSYQERYLLLVDRIGQDNYRYIKVAEKEICKDGNHLEIFLQDILDKGGEGVILRDPLSPYVAGRSPGYLKHKKFRDAEARILSRVGSHQWECELPNGVRFLATAGSSEFLRRYKPQEGDIVSFKHHGFLLASKKPKLPTIYRIRQDLTWQDVIHSRKIRTVSTTDATNSMLQRRRRTAAKTRPKGYWNDCSNRRKFFCEYAEMMGFDPSVAKNWAPITLSHIKRMKGWPFAGCRSLSAALKSAFPELEFQETKEYRTSTWWKDIRNCRSWFEELALQKGLDPLDTEGWYSVRLDKMKTRTERQAIKSQHGSLAAALEKAFPELSFDQHKFVRS